jgi:hypothetical protein
LFRAPPFHQIGTFRIALLRIAAAGAQEAAATRAITSWTCHFGPAAAPIWMEAEMPRAGLPHDRAEAGVLQVSVYLIGTPLGLGLHLRNAPGSPRSAAIKRARF